SAFSPVARRRRGPSVARADRRTVRFRRGTATSRRRAARIGDAVAMLAKTLAWLLRHRERQSTRRRAAIGRRGQGAPATTAAVAAVLIGEPVAQTAQTVLTADSPDHHRHTDAVHADGDQDKEARAA